MYKNNINHNPLQQIKKKKKPVTRLISSLNVVIGEGSESEEQHTSYSRLKLCSVIHHSGCSFCHPSHSHPPLPLPPSIPCLFNKAALLELLFVAPPPLTLSLVQYCVFVWLVVFVSVSPPHGFRLYGPSTGCQSYAVKIYECLYGLLD